MKNILFQRFELNELNKKYHYVDMHCHSNASDGCNNPKHIIKYAKQLGVGISIVDHNSIKGSLLASKRKDIFAIPGIEVGSSNAKDILLYFYNIGDLIEYFNKYINGNEKPNIGFNLRRTSLTESEIIDFARNYNCLIFLAHPFIMKPKDSYNLFSTNNKLLNKIDGIEVINSCMRLWRNEKTIEWFSRLKNKCFIAGSDMHHLSELGSSLTISRSFSVEGFLEDIRKRKNRVIGYSHQGMDMTKSKIRLVVRNLRLRK